MRGATVGWGSQPLKAALDKIAQRRARQKAAKAAASLDWLESLRREVVQEEEQVSPQEEAPAIRLPVSLAVALLKRGEAAVGRLWLLLRHLDQEGRGWLTLKEVRQRLTGKQARYRLCQPRQLRHLLQLGNGRFWQRQGERLWLVGVGRVAQRLGVTRRCGMRIWLPVGALLEGIGAVRAHLYATFHSGRKAALPISRAALGEITAVSPTSQRRYEAQVGLQAEAQYAVGERWGKEAVERRAWGQGGAIFRLVDKKGKLGRAGAAYVAWRLPNVYQGVHRLAGNGRLRAADLVIEQARGNSCGRRYGKDGRYWSDSRQGGLWLAR